MRTDKERTERILKKAERKRVQQRRRAGVLFACGAAVLSLALVLFVPYTVGGTDLSRYRDSEYYSLIGKIAESCKRAPVVTNNFRRWFVKTDNRDEGTNLWSPPADMGTDDPSESESGPRYEEVTDNQTEGAIEGDLFKRSGEYLYYLDASLEKPQTYTLRVYSLAGESSEEVGSYTVGPEEGTDFNGYAARRELYLSEDCSEVTVLSPCFDSKARVLYTVVVKLDVSDPTAPKELARRYLSGDSVSSRLIDGHLLLISDFSVRWDPDFGKPEEYLPQIGARGEMRTLPMSDIILPEDALGANYTIAAFLNAATLETEDALAFFSFTEEVYVSENRIFATRSVDRTYGEGSGAYGAISTQIDCAEYNGGELEFQGSVTAEGSLLNRYSLDEEENVLRVFTTSVRHTLSNAEEKPYSGRRCNLYCYDLRDWTELARRENFAPADEEIKSVRFDGERAYVCTASVTYRGGIAQITDPVFEFDLSDYTAIRCKDTGTIPGYSLALKPFGEGSLLGIGFGEGGSLKIAVYRSEREGLVESGRYLSERTFFSEEYKAYLIDAESGLVGLGVMREDRCEYLLLRYDGFRFTELLTVASRDVDLDGYRACLKDGDLYFVCGDGMTVQSLW